MICYNDLAQALLPGLPGYQNLLLLMMQDLLGPIISHCYLTSTCTFTKSFCLYLSLPYLTLSYLILYHLILSYLRLAYLIYRLSTYLSVCLSACLSIPLSSPLNFKSLLCKSVDTKDMWILLNFLELEDSCPPGLVRECQSTQ